MRRSTSWLAVVFWVALGVPISFCGARWLMPALGQTINVLSLCALILALGILVFQDLCVVPMILLIPLLSGTGGSAMATMNALVIALLVLGGVLVGARLLVPRLLLLVSRTRQRDLFVLSLFLACYRIYKEGRRPESAPAEAASEAPRSG